MAALALAALGGVLSIACLVFAALPCIDPLVLKVVVLLLLALVGTLTVAMQVKSKQIGGFDVSAPLYSGCPPWMRRLTYCVLGVGIETLVVARLVGVSTTSDSLLGTKATGLIGALGVMVFTVLFAQIYSILAIRERSRRDA